MHVNGVKKQLFYFLIKTLKQISQLKICAITIAYFLDITIEQDCLMQ